MTTAADPAPTSAAVTPPAAPPPAPAADPKAPPPATEGAPPAADPAKVEAEAKKEGEKTGETPEQVKKRWSRAAAAARQQAAQNRELRARNARLEQVAEGAQRAMGTAEQERQRQRQLATTPAGRLQLARELGLTPEQVIDAAMKDATPEAHTEARIRAAEERAAKAEKVVQDFLDSRTREEQQRVSRETAEKATTAFVAVSGDAAKFPKVAAMAPQARLAWAKELLTEDRRNAMAGGLTLEQYRAQYEPSDIQLLAHMEKLAGSSGGPPQASTVAAPAESSPGSTAPQTVSNGLTSAKFTLPANYDDLSDQEQRTIMARVLEERVPGAKKKPRG